MNYLSKGSSEIHLLHIISINSSKIHLLHIFLEIIVRRSISYTFFVPNASENCLGRLLMSMMWITDELFLQKFILRSTLYTLIILEMTL